jgi:hypothetical protein
VSRVALTSPGLGSKHSPKLSGKRRQRASERVQTAQRRTSYTGAEVRQEIHATHIGSLLMAKSGENYIAAEQSVLWRKLSGKVIVWS